MMLMSLKKMVQGKSSSKSNKKYKHNDEDVKEIDEMLFSDSSDEDEHNLDNRVDPK